MKQQDITDEVKRLAKKIAELWRMKVYKGCWFYWEDCLSEEDKLRLYDDEFWKMRELYCGELGYLMKLTTPGRNEWSSNEVKNWFPIPSIYDCEQKLIELGYESMNLTRRAFQNPWMIKVWDYESHDLDTDTIKASEKTGKSLHEIALSALLGVLRKEVGDD